MLNLIQNEMCHPERVGLMAGPTLYCHQCQKTLFHVYDYITKQSSDYFRSSELAQAFHAWTGDTQVPMNFVLVDLEGIFPKVVVGQSFNRIQKSIRLFKALNAPFLSNFSKLEDTYCEDMNTFLVDFINIIYEHPQPEEATNTRMILESLIKVMHDLLVSTKDSFHPFQTYFNTLVPFVQQCSPNWQPLPAPKPEENLALELMIQMKISNDIRNHFGPYSIPFDVIHVMVNCFACSMDMDAVGNFVLDFVARVCRGQYFWKRYPDSPFIQHMKQIIHQEISYRKRTEFFHPVLKPLQKGESSDHYSTLLKPFQECQLFLYGKFASKYDDVKEMAFHQAFPAVCFQEPSDQLGFMMGYNHILQVLQRNHGVIPKGTFKTAKTIHESVARFIQKVQEFDAITIQWTVETFQMFLVEYTDFERDILTLIETLIDKNNKDGNLPTKLQPSG